MQRDAVLPGRICPNCFEIIENTDVLQCPKDGHELRSLHCDLRPGSVVEGKYEIVEEISSGGFGSVYRAVQNPLKRVVAVKVLHGHVQRPELLKRFRREAMAASAVQHQAFPTLYSFGVLESGQPFLVMDFIEGFTLNDYIAKYGPLQPIQAARIFGEIASALDAAHNAGIIHRDVKPSNIMLTATPGSNRLRPYILDLGLAQLHDTGSASLHLTRSGETIGTPAYMSPEQCLGQEIDARSDIYSLGCCLYEALTGKVAFEGNSMFECMHRHVNEEPPSVVLGETPDFVSDGLSEIVSIALTKEPRGRFQTAAEMSNYLFTVAANRQSGRYRGVSDTQSIPLKRKESGPPLGLIIGGVCVLAIGLVLAINAINAFQANSSANNAEEAKEKLKRMLANKHSGAGFYQTPTGAPDLPPAPAINTNYPPDVLAAAAKPRIWAPVNIEEMGIKAVFNSRWQKGELHYRVALLGTRAALRDFTNQWPHFKVNFNDKGGLPTFVFAMNSSDFHWDPPKTNGGIPTMETSGTVPCELPQYTDGVQWNLTWE